MDDIETRLHELEKTAALQSRLIKQLGQLAEAHQKSLEALTGIQPAQPASLSMN